MEGLIGFIIMIIIINVASRLIKSLSSGQAKPQRKRPRVQVPPAPQESKGPGHPYREMAAQPEPARIARETPRPEQAPQPEAHEAAGWREDRFEETPEGVGEGFERWDEERFEKRRVESEGDIAQWAEDRFEEFAEVFGYKPKKKPERRRVRGAAKIRVQPVEAQEEAPEKLQAEEPSVEISAMPPAAYLETYREPLIGDLRDIEKVRKAIVLSAILGPCKARQRRRR
ncbi:MAG: hypothetical protein JSV33_08150 [bacterium]|nr:MAG: hypothetical protein JSV33_08150 [bacterium]